MFSETYNIFPVDENTMINSSSAYLFENLTIKQTEKKFINLCTSSIKCVNSSFDRKDGFQSSWTDSWQWDCIVTSTNQTIQIMRLECDLIF